MAETTELIECPRCGGAMEIDAEQLMFVCPYCGSREPLDSTTARRLNTETRKETAQAQLATERQVTERQDKARRTVKRIVLGIVIAFAVVIGASLVFNLIEDVLWDAEQSARINSEYTWPSSGLAQRIPQPAQTKGYIEDYSTSEFEIEVVCDSEDDWQDYVQAVRAAGFTIDEETTGHEFSAYDKDGYQVDVYFYSYSNPQTMDIKIDEPLQAHALTWPSSGVGSLVPAPESLMGQIERDSGDSFQAIITDTTPDVYAAYVEKCIQAGFNQRYNRQDRRFYGYDTEGHALSVEYIGFNKMEVYAYTVTS